MESIRNHSVGDGWAVAIPINRCHQVADFRQRKNLDVCVETNWLWMRGRDWNDDINRRLRRILGSRRYRDAGNGQLVPQGKSVPTRLMPGGPWVGLDEWLTLSSPVGSYPAANTKRASLRLIRGGQEQPTNVLVTSFAQWRDYALSAPKCRLDRLCFAVGDDSVTIIRGRPTPPIPGNRYVESQCVATPAGWIWWPHINASVLRNVLGLQDQDMALFTLKGEYDFVSGDAFVQTSRSAIRITENQLNAD